VHIRKVDQNDTQLSMEAYNRSAQLPPDAEQDHSNRVMWIQTEDQACVVSMVDSIVTHPEHVVLTLDELGRAAGERIARSTPATA